MIGSLGFGEILIIFIIALIVFGPRKLPELGKSLGRGLSEFKKASNDLKRTWEDEVRAEDEKIRQLTSMSEAPPRQADDLTTPSEDPTRQADDLTRPSEDPTRQADDLTRPSEDPTRHPDDLNS